MTAHLIHGVNVWDGGEGSIGALRPFFRDHMLHSYGWVGALFVRCRNDKVVANILPQIRRGDSIIAHSNGCLIAWRLVEAGAPVSCVVCIQPALRRDTLWRAPVLCLYNKRDWVVSLGRMWGRFASVANPWRDLHGWGAAGRHGFDHGTENWDTDTMPFPVVGHSGIWRRPEVSYWGVRIRRWSDERSIEG